MQTPVWTCHQKRRCRVALTFRVRRLALVAKGCPRSRTSLRSEKAFVALVAGWFARSGACSAIKLTNKGVSNSQAYINLSCTGSLKPKEPLGSNKTWTYSFIYAHVAISYLFLQNRYRMPRTFTALAALPYMSYMFWSTQDLNVIQWVPIQRNEISIIALLQHASLRRLRP